MKVAVWSFAALGLFHTIFGFLFVVAMFRFFHKENKESIARLEAERDKVLDKYVCPKHHLPWVGHNNPNYRGRRYCVFYEPSLGIVPQHYDCPQEEEAWSGK